MASIIIFIAVAFAGCTFLVMILIAMKILRKKYSSKQFYNHDNKLSGTPPVLGFTLPPYIPKTISYTNDADMIDPELYKDDTKQKETSPAIPGSLCFSVKYEETTEKLIVGVIRGQRIRPKTNNPTATLYVKICLLPDRRKKLQTKTKQNAPHPLFYEEFVFQCPLSELRQRCLMFTVCDFDRFSRQNVIGSVTFSLHENYDQIMTKHGCVEIWRDIDEFEPECTSSGEILLSLQYLPTAKRVAIVILRGRGFDVEGNGKSLSIYVKVTMIVDGKSSRNRKTTKCHDSEPVFNESFHFDMPDGLVDRTSFIVSVINHKNLIGRVVVGPFLYAAGTGLVHWNDMVNSPHSAISMWHSLY